MHSATRRGGSGSRLMKRNHLVPTEFLVLVAMALAFVVLASPATAAQPCLGLGEYYTVARQCAVEPAALGGTLPMLAVYAALAAVTVGLMSLRRHLLRTMRR